MIKQISHEANTRKTGFLERVLVGRREEDPSNHASKLSGWWECRTRALWRSTALARSVVMAHGAGVLIATSKNMLLSWAVLLH